MGFARICLLGVAVAAMASARLSPVMSISALVEESEVIAVGEVTAVEQTGNETFVENGTAWPVTRMTANVRLLELLKGDAVPKLFLVSFIESVDQMGNGPLTAATYVGHHLLFLKREQGSYVFADAVFGSIPVIPNCSPAIAADSTAYEKTVRRAACALVASGATY